MLSVQKRTLSQLAKACKHANLHDSMNSCRRGPEYVEYSRALGDITAELCEEP